MNIFNLSQPDLIYIQLCDNADNNNNYLLLPKETLGHIFLYRDQVPELCPIFFKTIRFSFQHSDICFPWRFFEWRISSPHLRVNNSGDTVASTAMVITGILSSCLQFFCQSYACSFSLRATFAVFQLELRLQFFTQSYACRFSVRGQVQFFSQSYACSFPVRATFAVCLLDLSLQFFSQSYACSFSVRVQLAVFLLELSLQFFTQSYAWRFFVRAVLPGFRQIYACRFQLQLRLHFFVRAQVAVFCQSYACSFSVEIRLQSFNQGYACWFQLQLRLQFFIRAQLAVFCQSSACCQSYACSFSVRATLAGFYQSSPCNLSVRAQLVDFQLELRLQFPVFLSAFRKIAKSAYQFRHVSLSVCPSVCMELNPQVAGHKGSGTRCRSEARTIQPSVL